MNREPGTDGRICDDYPGARLHLAHLVHAWQVMESPLFCQRGGILQRGAVPTPLFVNEGASYRVALYQLPPLRKGGRAGI